MEFTPKEYTPHRFFCEIELFNRRAKGVWQRECPYKHRPAYPSLENECDYCKHCIMVIFEDNECTKAVDISRGQ